MLRCIWSSTDWGKIMVIEPPLNGINFVSKTPPPNHDHPSFLGIAPVGCSPAIHRGGFYPGGPSKLGQCRKNMMNWRKWRTCGGKKKALPTSTLAIIMNSTTWIQQNGLWKNNKKSVPRFEMCTPCLEMNMLAAPPFLLGGISLSQAIPI